MPAFLLVLTLGIAAGWLSRRVGLPAAIGQVALGAVLGPAALGWVAPDDALGLLAEIGVVLLLGTTGLDRLMALGWETFWALSRRRFLGDPGRRGQPVSPGEVALVVADMGFRQGHLNHHVFLALIPVTVFVAIVAPRLIMGRLGHTGGKPDEVGTSRAVVR